MAEELSSAGTLRLRFWSVILPRVAPWGLDHRWISSWKPTSIPIRQPPYLQVDRPRPSQTFQRGQLSRLGFFCTVQHRRWIRLLLRTPKKVGRHARCQPAVNFGQWDLHKVNGTPICFRALMPNWTAMAQSNRPMSLPIIFWAIGLSLRAPCADNRKTAKAAAITTANER